MNNKVIINNYIEALTARAEQSGDGRLEYAMGFLQSTLNSLNLGTYELETLQRDAKNLQDLISSSDRI